MGRSFDPGRAFDMRVERGLTTSMLLIAAVGGCSEDQLNRARAALEADPPALDFGEGCVGETNLATTVLTNRGSGVARFVGARIEPADAPFVAPELPEGLGPGREIELSVGYEPPEPERMDSATLVLELESPNEPLRIALSGVGGLRRFAPFPEHLDFGVVNEGSPAVRAFELRNEGGSPLTIRELVWTSTSIDLAPLEGTFAGGTIAAKQTARFEIVYDPVDLGADQGTLVVFSDDPTRPRIELAVSARANLKPRIQLYGCRQTGEDGCPEALRATTVAAGLEDVVALDAREAFDPEGGPLTFAWSVVERPEDSTSAPFSLDPADPFASVLVDRSGNYVVRAVARDGRGLTSDPSDVRIRPPDLRFVLRWNLATDVDLHLVRPEGQVGDYGNGVVGRSTGSDCSPFNRGPVWGEATPLDDPRFERDAVTSRGPESSSLDRPEAGAYGVFAHYCDSRNVRSATEVRIEVWSRGEMVGEVGPQTLQPGELWLGTQIVWDAGSEQPTLMPGTEAPSLRPDICRSN